MREIIEKKSFFLIAKKILNKKKIVDIFVLKIALIQNCPAILNGKKYQDKISKNKIKLTLLLLIFL
jgi:hypothetical protein